MKSATQIWKRNSLYSDTKKYFDENGIFIGTNIYNDSLIFIDFSGKIEELRTSELLGDAITDLFKNVYFHSVDKCKSQKSCPEGYVLVDIKCELDLHETVIEDPIRDIIKDIPTFKQYVNTSVFLRKLKWGLDVMSDSDRLDIDFSIITTCDQVTPQLVAKNNRVGNNSSIMIDLVAKVEQKQWEIYVEEYM